MFLGLSLFSGCVHFSYSKGSSFLIFSGLFRGSSTRLFCFIVLLFLHSIGLLSLPRVHVINYNVGHVWHRLWQSDFTHNHKQAQDPPGSLHAIVSPVEWSSLKGRGPRWFTVRKTIWFTKCDFTYNGKRVTNRLKIPQGLSTLCFVSGVKFPQGEGSAVIHRKKDRPALQRRDCWRFV